MPIHFKIWNIYVFLIQVFHYDFITTPSLHQSYKFLNEWNINFDLLGAFFDEKYKITQKRIDFTIHQSGNWLILNSLPSTINPLKEEMFQL